MAKAPASDKAGIGFAPEFQLFQLEEFEGLNTKARRPAIKDQEMSWIENWMPIGPANARLMAGKGVTKYTAPGGKTIVWTFTYNVAAVFYAAMFLSDGTAIQVRLSDGATTTISSTANRFYNGGDLPHAVQWANSGILIVTTAVTDGYFAWDGTTLFKPGDTAPSWLSGLDASITEVGDMTAGSAIITNVTPNPISNGVIAGMTITGIDVPANTIIGAGTATTITTSSVFANNHVGETFTINWAMPFGVKGTAIETFENRVWIVSGALIQTSAPSNGATFSAANGGINKPSNDSNLRVKYVAIHEANGFLYVFGDSSNYYITNVQTTATAGVPTTTYQYTTLDEQVGTPWRDTVEAFGRSLLFANPNGVYAIFGSSATKVSDALDGLFSVADFSLIPSTAAATLFNIKVATFNFKTTDYLGVARPLMAAFDGKRWWLASQETAPTQIVQQEEGSVLSTYGNDGTTFFRCFDATSATLIKTIRSKLWGGEYGFLSKKNALRQYLQIDTSNASDAAQITMTLDSETGSSPGSAVTGSSALTFVNNVGGVLQFQNNGGGNLTFVVPNTITAINAAGAGYILGFTLTTTSKDLTLERAAIGYKDQWALY